jgi:hypothetical protein
MIIYLFIYLTMDGKCADISYADTGSSTTAYAYRFESENLLNPANQVDSLYTVVNTDISKIVAKLYR